MIIEMIMSSFLVFTNILSPLNLLVNTTSTNRTELVRYVSDVPKHILNDLVDADYKITLSNQPGENYGVKHIDGITDTDNNIIIIKDYEGKFEKSVVHEIGHAFDDVKDFPSKTEEFAKIYQTEKDLLDLDNHYKSNEQEYFAAVFNLYIKDSMKLKKEAPGSYTFIRELINEDRK